MASNYALNHSITFIETGRMYDGGKTEQWIGQAVSHRRDEYVLASYEEAAREIEQSTSISDGPARGSDPGRA